MRGGACTSSILRMLYAACAAPTRPGAPIRCSCSRRTAGARSATAIGGTLFDFGKGTLVPARELVAELLALVAEDAQALGCEAEIARVGRIVEEGTSADRQIATFKASLDKGLTKEDALCAVVDELIAETVSDL